MKQVKAYWRMLFIYTVLAAAQVVFVLLKITGTVDWSWTVVLIPLWIFVFREIILMLVQLIITKP